MRQFRCGVGQSAFYESERRNTATQEVYDTVEAFRSFVCGLHCRTLESQRACRHVIVPEGVIFQSGTAYKDLRKMLVDNYLYAVVSLPAGVFNPYSGVKTSILLMDKEFAKTS
jgi:type I restriction-modification system DNA methylase subunit